MNSRPWLAAPVLGVRDVRRAAEHYRDALGFHLDPERGVFQPTADEPGGVYAILTRPGVMIHLQIRRNAAVPSARPAFERDVYVYVDDVDAVHADVARRGATILQEPRLAPHGIREMVVEDLDGHRIAFGQAG